MLDYGQCIRDLAYTNIFPGDLLLKNFGVTRHGRVIFYDYDELCQVTDCNFRDVPQATNPEDEMRGEAWFYVGENDVFPETFITSSPSTTSSAPPCCACTARSSPPPSGAACSSASRGRGAGSAALPSAPGARCGQPVRSCSASGHGTLARLPLLQAAARASAGVVSFASIWFAQSQSTSSSRNVLTYAARRFWKSR